MREWIDFVAILTLAIVGLMGMLLISHGVPIPDDITLLLFGAGTISSLILIKTKNHSKIGNPRTPLENEGGK